MPIWLIQIVVGIVFSVASTLIEQAWGPKSNTKSAASGYSASLQTGGGSAQYFIIGTWGTAGKLEYANAWGNDGDTPNAYLVYVISLGDLPITALTGAYENGEALTVGTGTHTTQGYPIPQRQNGSSDRFWIEFHDGSQTTVNTYLSGKFGSDATIPWLSDMIGRGIPYVTTTALFDRTVWNNTPQSVFQAQGIPLYDPRKDSTAGGSGIQRLNDQTTWAFTDNIAVMIYNILVGIRYENVIQWGGHVGQGQLPYANWSAAMDVCDVAIPLAAGGTEKQFRGGRQVNFSDKPADIISDFLVACNGRMTECAGTYTILVGAPQAAVATFTDDDVIVTEDATLDPFPNLDNLVNGAVATYTEPSQAWQTKETAPYAPSDLLAEDRGQVLTANIDLTNTVFSGTQAQRIEAAAVKEGRRFLKHVVPLRPVWGNYRPLGTVAWNSAENAYSGKGFLVTAWTEEANGNVIYGLQEIDPSDHDWSVSDESALSFAPLIPLRPAPQPMSGWAASASTVQDDNGADRRPAIIVGASGEMVDVQSVHIQVRLATSEAVVFDGYSPYDPTVTSPSWILSGEWCLPATAYGARGKLVPFSGRKTYWSNETLDGDGNPVDGDWLGVTTPNISLGKADFSDALNAQLTWATSAINDLINNQDILSTLLNDQDKANFVDKTQILANLAMQFGASTAAISSVAQVAASANEATAAIATAAQVTANQATASGLVSLTLDSGGSGTTAKITQELSTSTGGGAVTSAMETLEIDSDGTSIKTIVADKFRLTDASADTLFEWSSIDGTLSIGNA